jgi:hypothetical protein
VRVGVYLSLFLRLLRENAGADRAVAPAETLTGAVKSGAATFACPVGRHDPPVKFPVPGLANPSAARVPTELLRFGRRRDLRHGPAGTLGRWKFHHRVDRFHDHRSEQGRHPEYDAGGAQVVKRV